MQCSVHHWTAPVAVVAADQLVTRSRIVRERRINCYLHFPVTAVAPILSLSPMFTITQGASLTLDCQVSGSPTPSIMWFKDGAPLIGNNRVTVGETVSIVGAFSSDAGTYMCLAQNSIGNSTASTVLSVIGTHCI